MRIIEGFRLRNIMGQATIIGEGVGQVDFNKIITLNNSAAFLWRSLEDKDFDILEVADILAKEYSIDTERAISDATAIVNKWIEVGIVK